MTKSDFFKKPTEASKLKAKLVAEYFDTWSNIILPSVKRNDKKFAYIDFFAGPGAYKDGTKSTPLLVLEKTIQHPEKRDMLVSIFNDSNPEHVDKLKNSITSISSFNLLKYKPEFRNVEIISDSTIVEELTKIELIPTLFFVDPCGYQGLSLELIYCVLKDWGSDGIFFFNYHRINMALSNPFMSKHMELLFGNERSNDLKTKIKTLSPREREKVILDDLVDALKDIGGSYVIDFRFPKFGQERTSHYLIFVSKHIKGYKAMKEILARNSSSSTQGVASFEYSPSSESTLPLPIMDGPLDKLEKMLLTKFKGKSLTMQEIYDQHDIGKYYTRYYTEGNYKDALRNLENKGQIIADPPSSKRPSRYGKVTFGPMTKVTFKRP